MAESECEESVITAQCLKNQEKNNSGRKPGQRRPTMTFQNSGIYMFEFYDLKRQLFYLFIYFFRRDTLD